MVIGAVLNGLKGEKLAPNWPQPLALAAKFTPKWPKMAAKGPHWYHVVTVWPIEPDLWLGEKLAPNWPQPLALAAKSGKNWPLKAPD